MGYEHAPSTSTSQAGKGLFLKKKIGVREGMSFTKGLTQLFTVLCPHLYYGIGDYFWNIIVIQMNWKVGKS